MFSHFHVDPSEWNTKKLVEPLLRGTFISLISPSQTGKTTRAKTLQAQLNSTHQNVLCLRICLTRVFVLSSTNRDEEGYSFLSTFIEIFQDEIVAMTGKRPNVNKFEDLFSLKACALYYENKKIILLIDDAPWLKLAKQDERIYFLTMLRQLKKDHCINNCLLSALIITHCNGPYLLDMFGESAFNEIVRAPYFSIGELKQLFKQYQDQEGIEISNSIKDDIFMQTNGSQGLVATFGHLLDQWVKFNKRSPTFCEWFNYSRSKLIF